MRMDSDKNDVYRQRRHKISSIKAHEIYSCYVKKKKGKPMKDKFIYLLCGTTWRPQRRAFIN